MKKILLTAFFFSMVSISIAQTGPRRAEDCKLKLSQAPVIRGIRLGTSIDQALAMFPGASGDQALRDKLSNVRFGSQTVLLSPGTYGSREKFEGVKSVYLVFLDGQLNLFSLIYNGPEWTSDEQFASKVAEALNLPAVEYWRRVQGGEALSCDGFEVTVRGENHAEPTIEVKNIQIEVDKTLRERKEEPKEKARRAFKP